jgi:predicted metal-dependent phosphoesterase TrpH|tara:strand:- start:413 stop:1249 length:837 start_codon:yes stop_codon:yes gene_type:complete
MIYDLHSHTTASDGKLSPKELIDYTIGKKLSGIAITDHDTIEGISEALEYAKNKPLELIPGIEISCDCEEKVKEIHIVRLFIDYTNSKFKKLKLENERKGKKKAKEIIKKLKVLNYEIDFSKLEKINNFGKSFIAELLLEKYPNDFKDRKDVFNKLLGWGKPAMVHGEGVSMQDAIKIIHDAGGIAIFAHPGQLREYDDYFINKFIKFGGDGIEVGIKYPYLNNGKELNKKYKKIITENNLLVSSGTDFHYKKEDKDFGDYGINQKEFLKMKRKNDLI